MSPRFQPTKAIAHTRLGFNADMAAILLALGLAALIRLNVIPHIGW
ncbi:MAG: hypothetical protein PW735_05175 [Acidobacteriaceae bacterium]|nr:hypothetical protein [Acidobacteriaceae bacterium]